MALVKIQNRNQALHTYCGKPGDPHTLLAKTFPQTRAAQYAMTISRMTLFVSKERKDCKLISEVVESQLHDYMYIIYHNRFA